MNEMSLTDDQCDRLVAMVMDKLAAKHSDQYGATHAMDLNQSITEHHTLRRSVVQAAYMLGALEMQQLAARKPLTDAVLVPIGILKAAESSLGSFCCDHGWSDDDMQAMDNLSAYIAKHKAANGIKDTPC